MFLRVTGAIAASLGLALVMLLGRPAEAAPITVTVTASGEITFGIDYDGSITGTAGEDLAGLSASIVQTLEFDSSALPVAGSDPAQVLANDVTLTITINAYPALIFSSASPSAGFALYTITSVTGGPPASIDSQAAVLLSSGAIASTLVQVVHPASDFTTVPPDLLQEFSFLAAPAGGTWTAGGALFDDQFNILWEFVIEDQGMRSLDIDVARAPTGVSEPGSIAALAASLGALVAIRRRAARIL
jgi:hypothetical protein